MSDSEQSTDDEINILQTKPQTLSPMQQTRSNNYKPSISPAARAKLWAERERKMAQKEKAIYEMVDSLNGRLDKLNRTVRSQHDLCVNDVNPNNEELGNGEGGGGGNQRSKPPFGAASSGGDELGLGLSMSMSLESPSMPPNPMSDDNKNNNNNNNNNNDHNTLFNNNHKQIPTSGIPAHTRLTWRDSNLPSTDAGKRLDMMFDTMHGKQKNKKNKGKLQGMTNKKNMESRKDARVRLQKVLDINSENYVTRAVNSVVYMVPSESAVLIAAVGGGGGEVEGGSVAGQSQMGDLTDPTNVDPQVGENWPIKIGGSEMHPR